MNGIIQTLKNKERLVVFKPADTRDITEAESKLELKFAGEYKEYAAAYGAASYYGHELTGICGIPYLDVVSVTEQERSVNPKVPQNWYVVEETHIDGIVFWQDENGVIYRSHPNAIPVKVYDSMEEYVMHES